MLEAEFEYRLPHYTLQLSFQMEKEIIALFGPSGAGKTTALHILAGLTKPDQGNLILNGRTLIAQGKSKVPVQKRRIGYVFQDYALFPHRTVQQNIHYGMKDPELTEMLVNELQMTHLLHQYPHEISGGEKQRTALIRALATAPELLLLDEPFSALDEKTKEQSYEQLIRVHEKSPIPILFVSHNRNEVNKLADRVLHLSEGKITSEKRSSKIE